MFDVAMVVKINKAWVERLISFEVINFFAKLNDSVTYAYKIDQENNRDISVGIIGVVVFNRHTPLNQF